MLHVCHMTWLISISLKYFSFFFNFSRLWESGHVKNQNHHYFHSFKKRYKTEVVPKDPNMHFLSINAVCTFKVPLLWVIKGSYFGFGSPQQQVDMHARSKNTFHLSYNMHLFLPYLLNDTQTIRSTIHFSKPLLCVTLICCDWSNWSHFHFIMPVMPDKAVFVSAVLLCVQRYWGNRFFYRSKSAPNGKEWICIFIQTQKDELVGMQYANISCWCQHETAWD